MNHRAVIPKTGFVQLMNDGKIETSMFFRNQQFAPGKTVLAEVVQKIKNRKEHAYEVEVDEQSNCGSEGIYTRITIRRPLESHEASALNGENLGQREEAARIIRLVESRVIGEAFGLAMSPLGERIKHYMQAAIDDFSPPTRKGVFSQR